MIHYEASLQRQAQIENTLLELMQKVPYGEISVKDIAQQMQFARKTFYHYFPNKHACLEALTDRLIYECNLQIMQILPETPSLLDYYIEQIAFWVGQRDFLEVIIRNGLHSFLVERFILYFRKEDPAATDLLHRSQLVQDEDMLFFYTTGQVFLMLKWCAQDFPMSVEEMARKTVQLVHQPLLPLSSQ